jgi:membrane-associated phospholipid phosphatase
MSTALVSNGNTASGKPSREDYDLRGQPAGPASRGHGKRGWLVWGAFIIAGILAMGVDVPLSQAMVQSSSALSQVPLRRWLHDFLGSIEPFGQPPAVITVSLAVYLCGGRRRSAAIRIAGSFLLASLTVNAVKLCVARVRPRHFEFGGTVLDTFQGALWGTEGGTRFQSFPSGHTTVAVAFCLALWAIFPRGCWLFTTLAALVALQRIECGAHYLSDTLFAASLAYAVHVAVFGDGPLGRWFNKLETMSSRG